MKNLNKIAWPIFIVLLSITGIFVYEQGKGKSVQVIERYKEVEIADKKIVIHVDGAVKNPGIYQVTENIHLYEVLLLAEPLPDADLQKFNLAEVLQDGKLIRVPSITKTVVKKEPINQTQQITKVNVNKSGINDLSKIPGIGVSYAERIVSYREEFGFFNSLNDLLNVKGIGPAKLKSMEKYITLE